MWFKTMPEIREWASVIPVFIAFIQLTSFVCWLCIRNWACCTQTEGKESPRSQKSRTLLEETDKCAKKNNKDNDSEDEDNSQLWSI